MKRFLVFSIAVIVFSLLIGGAVSAAVLYGPCTAAAGVSFLY